MEVYVSHAAVFLLRSVGFGSAVIAVSGSYQWIMCGCFCNTSLKVGISHPTDPAQGLDSVWDRIQLESQSESGESAWDSCRGSGGVDGPHDGEEG